MQILFDSMTGNVRRFSQKLGEACGLAPVNLKTQVPEEPFLLLTYTFGQGEIPTTTAKFLEQHSAGLYGVVSSGSFHWGDNFALAGDRIAAAYGVPLVAKINKSGSANDVQVVTDWLIKRG